MYTSRPKQYNEAFTRPTCNINNMPQRSLSPRSQSQNSWTIVKDHNKHNKIILRNGREGTKKNNNKNDLMADRQANRGSFYRKERRKTITRTLKLKANNC